MNTFALVKNRPYEDDYATERSRQTTSRFYPRYTTPRTVYTTTTTTEPPYEYDDSESFEEEDENDDDEYSTPTDASVRRSTFHGDFETVDNHKVSFGSI